MCSRYQLDSYWAFWTDGISPVGEHRREVQLVRGDHEGDNDGHNVVDHSEGDDNDNFVTIFLSN